MPADMPPSHCSRPTCLRQGPIADPQGRWQQPVLKVPRSVYRPYQLLPHECQA